MSERLDVFASHSYLKPDSDVYDTEAMQSGWFGTAVNSAYSYRRPRLALDIRSQIAEKGNSQSTLNTDLIARLYEELVIPNADHLKSTHHIFLPGSRIRDVKLGDWDVFTFNGNDLSGKFAITGLQNLSSYSWLHVREVIPPAGQK